MYIWCVSENYLLTLCPYDELDKVLLTVTCCCRWVQRLELETVHIFILRYFRCRYSHKIFLLPDRISLIWHLTDWLMSVSTFSLLSMGLIIQPHTSFVMNKRQLLRVRAPGWSALICSADVLRITCSVMGGSSMPPTTLIARWMLPLRSCSLQNRRFL